MNERHNHNGSSHAGDEIPAELLTAYALGQLDGPERAEVERPLADPNQADAVRQVRETKRLASGLTEAHSSEPLETSPSGLRAIVDERLLSSATEKVELPAKRRPWYRLTVVEAGVIISLCCLLAAMLLPSVQSARESARRISSSNRVTQLKMEFQQIPSPARQNFTSPETEEGEGYRYQTPPLQTLPPGAAADAQSSEAQPWFDKQIQDQSERLTTDLATVTESKGIAVELNEFGDGYAPNNDLSANVGSYQGGGVSGQGGRTAKAFGGNPQPTTGPVPTNGKEPFYPQPNETTTRPALAERSKELPSLKMQVTPRIIVQEEAKEGAQADFDSLTDIITTTVVPGTWDEQLGTQPVAGEPAVMYLTKSQWEQLAKQRHWYKGRQGQGGEQYEQIIENAFLAPRQNPLSTFSIDVDTASYANVRRFLTGGSLPPANAVRIEELVNYFRYDYPQPKGPEPFSVNMEAAECPWNDGHLLLRVGLKGKDVHRGERPQSNLVFLLDVSGSMADENKLPLLKTAMQMFTRELGENDRVAIVTYAGEAGLRLPPTRGHEHAKILGAIESLSSGGSTNGSAGIELAYEQAKAYFVEGGTNRVILCTDGDLNVGITDDGSLVELIKKKAEGGTFLTVLGFGEGNLKDAKMEKLADNGNGLYAYIDSVREARKVLVEQMTGSTITIAKDVKIQIEFNPAQIASYRLLGYENRVLAAQDFNDDKKDAGEIGAGHTVTALYELVPVGAKSAAAAPQPGVEPLKYQALGDRGQATEDKEPGAKGQEPAAATLTDAAKSGELLTLKLRYKEPEAQVSKLLEVPLKDRGGKFNAASKDLQFAAAVASFGMILRGSEHKGNGNLAAVAEIAGGAISEDPSGYRAEFVDLVRKAQSLGAR